MKINGKAARSLTLPQVRMLREFADANEADIFALSAAYDQDMTDWFMTASAGDAIAAIGHVWEVSGLTEGARFQDAQADDAGYERDGI